MELKALFLFFTIYSSIEAFTIEHDPTQFNDNDGLAVIAQNDDCQCKNGRCVKDNRGKTKCNCKHGYALQDEFTCEPCDCGSKGSCTFVRLSKPTGGFSYVKKCICDQGSAEKDGVCVDCECGENGKCEFEDGEKVCYCTEGYAEKDGVCTIENCNKGKCKGTDCNCCPGYGIKRNFRRGDSCKKCNCGQNFSCSFDSRSRKTCKCPAGYSEKRGICTGTLDI